MKRHLYVAIPNHSNSLRGEMCDSLVTAGIEATLAGWGFTVERLNGHIHHIARNILLGRFLANEAYTDIVWWDDDVAIKPGTFVPFIQHDVAFVCAPYRHKRDIESYPGMMAEPPHRKMHESASTGTPLFNAEYWVIGMSRQTRACAEQIAHADGIVWEDDDFFPDVRVPNVFENLRIGTTDGPQKTVGEDYVYCRRWIDLGGNVWVDPLMQTGHSGNHIWWGHLGLKLQREVEEYRAQAAARSLVA